MDEGLYRALLDGVLLSLLEERLAIVEAIVEAVIHG